MDSKHLEKTVVQKKPIAWAVDAFQCDKKMLNRIELALEQVYGAETPAIQPIFVLTSSAVKLPGPWFAELSKQLKIEADKKLEGLLSSGHLNYASPVILLQDPEHKQRDVEIMQDYVKQAGFDMLLIATSGRTGLEGALLGSFAESMLLQAEVPLLTIGPQFTGKSSGERCILCPVDLNSDSKQIIKLLNSVAAKERQGAQIVLFHVLPSWEQSSSSFTSIALSSSPDEAKRFFDKERSYCEELASKIVREFKGEIKGVEVEIKPYKSYVYEAIRDYAEERKVSFVAMSSRNDRQGRIFTGSTTRHFVRMAPCPTWVIPPHAL